MPSSQLRSTDTHAMHAMSSSVPASFSSSLSSSLSSSRASSDLLPAVPLSNSSQADIITSDRSASSLPSSSRARFFPLNLTPTAVSSRSVPLAAMGQNQARPTPPPLSSPPLSPAPSTTSRTGNRLKRWAGRKKSVDVTSDLERARGKDCSEGGAAAYPPSAMPDLSELRLERPPSRGLGGPKLHLPNVFGGKKPNQQQKQSLKVSPDVHLLPPTPHQSQSGDPGQPTPSSSPPHTPPKTQFSTEATVPKPSQLVRPAPISTQPSVGGDVGTPRAVDKSGISQEKEKTKEDWRKSDSTMASHSTIRPGALSGNRSPRPVSLAESSHSTTTIVAPVNKRLSALITDAEFTMFEETDGSVSEQETIPRPPASGRPSPTSSLKARNRRSASLSLVPVRRLEAPSSSGRNFSDNPLASYRDTPTLTRTAAAGIISPVSAGSSTQVASNNIRGRLAAWTVPSASTPQSQPQLERALPPLPPPQPRRPPGSMHPPPVNPTFRQTAVSMTGSLAPAAGIAMGFGKRAVEKVGRAWGGLTSSASSHSGYSSSSSTGMSDSASASSHYSGPGGRKARRRAQHAFSNASSISSLASTSSEDHYTQSGPQLEKRLRGPKQSGTGQTVIGGLLFRRDLRACVRETAIDDVLIRIANSREEADAFGFRPLESRLLPALILRCAQHILRWGLEEEGLFRVSGRSSHVAKLRAEFDAGADYLLSECDPGDLDPHAVSSIFKTFLRELPEPVLTSALLPYFESALADDQGRRSEDVTKEARNPISESHLPLRKPPSLSTLAMPSFAGARPVSDAQLNALSWLISRLPPENRDLLYTVIELIKVTAARSKETKMPLGNLLLVFCPSLNMSPTLLRVLSEAAGIWNGPPAQSNQPTAPDDTRTDLVAIERDTTRSRSGSRGVVPAIDLRFPIVEDDSADNVRESPDDAASFVSALEPPSNPSTRTPSPLIYGNTIPPLSSSDSLDSSSVSEELVSPDPPSSGDAGDNKSFASSHSLAIPESAMFSLPTLPKPAITVPFPSAGGSVPHSPVTHQPLTHRKSYTLLSFPHHRSETTSDVGCEEQQSPTRRPKRPSLHLLFTKKSTSSLPSSTCSGNVPIRGANTRANTHLASSPPRLDTTISSSPIYLGFEAHTKQTKGKDASSTVRSAPTIVTCSTLEAPALNSRSDSGGSSLFSTPQSTPIADYYRGRTTSLFLPDTEAPGEMSPPTRPRSVSQVSDTPSIDIEVAETEQDDWTKSVLLAAQAG